MDENRMHVTLGAAEGAFQGARSLVTLVYYA